MNKQKTQRKRLEHWQLVAALLVIFDIVMVNASYLLALYFRFDCIFSAIPDYYLEACYNFFPIYSVICLAVLHLSQILQKQNFLHLLAG